MVLAAASLGGLLAFLYPFVLPGISQATDDTAAHTGAAPLLFAGVTIVSLLATLVTIADDQAGVGRSKTIALLGVLVAIDATLRLVPSIAGASPVFLLIILVGFVFGPLMGFQMGALTLLLSGFITGGIGPWLPFQMLASGWIGMTAGWLPHPVSERARIAMLAAFGALWGLVFGALMNIWFWPFTAPGAGTDASLYWSPDLHWPRRSSATPASTSSPRCRSTPCAPSGTSCCSSSSVAPSCACSSATAPASPGSCGRMSKGPSAWSPVRPNRLRS